MRQLDQSLLEYLEVLAYLVVQVHLEFLAHLSRPEFLEYLAHLSHLECPEDLASLEYLGCLEDPEVQFLPVLRPAQLDLVVLVDLLDQYRQYHL